MTCSLILGALIGWIAGKLMGSRGGLIRNLILGVVGSAVGNWLAGAIGKKAPRNQRRKYSTARAAKARASAG